MKKVKYNLAFFICYYLSGDVMNRKNFDAFDKEQKYKLYRSVYDILHPTISKKNISNYKIIINEDMASVRVFYPVKVSNISNVIIYIHGDGNVTGCGGNYSNICKNMAIESNHLIIAIDYEDFGKIKYDELYDNIYQMIKYLFIELNECGIKDENVILCGDSTGASIVISITNKILEKDKIEMKKQILFYPVVSMEYFGKTKFESIDKYEQFNTGLVENLKKYFKKIGAKRVDLKKAVLYPLFNQDYSKFPSTLIFTGNNDCLKDEGYEYYKKISNDRDNDSYVEIAFGTHGFLCGKDKEIMSEVNKQMKKFLEN